MNPGGSQTPPRLIAHVVHRFDYGGLENGLVNLINHLPSARYAHCVVALTEASEFRRRIRRCDVEVYSLGKRPGKDPRAYTRLFGLLRRIRPDIVHTRNYGALDSNIVAAAAGVRTRVHGEHGWDVDDPDGTVRRYQVSRRVLAPLVQRFVAVSRDLEDWLIERCRVPRQKVTRICNGVDTDRFSPAEPLTRQVLPEAFRAPDLVVIGSVTRLSPIKDPLNVVLAFDELRRHSTCGGVARLVIVGDGEMRKEAEALVASRGLRDLVWLAGSREDIPDLLRAMDVFVLGSRREGISNTVLEAMAAGLPVVATSTGGNLELVRDGLTGTLAPPEDSAALASALRPLLESAGARHQYGTLARRIAVDEFSIRAMVDSYDRMYSGLRRLRT